MSDLSLIPLQDGFETQLSQDWDGNTGTIYVLATPSYTPTTTNTYIVVNPGKTNMQIAEITDYDSTAKTLTVSSISFEKGLGISSTAQDHSTGSKVIISDNYQFWEDIQTAINSKLDKNGGNTAVYASTAARDSALGGNGAATLPYSDIYVTATGIFYNYNLSTAQWESVDTGTLPGNATNLAAGLVRADVSPAGIPVALIQDNPKYGALAGTGGNPSASNLFETQYDTSNGATKTATTISFTSGTKTIADSGNGFVTAGFKQGTQITITGSASNNGTFTIVSVAAGAIVVAESLVTEAAGATVVMTTVNASKLVRANGSGKIDTSLLSDGVILSVTTGENVTAANPTYINPSDSLLYVSHGFKELDSTALSTASSTTLKGAKLSSTQVMYLTNSGATLTITVYDINSATSVATQTVSTIFDVTSISTILTGASVCRMSDTTFIVFYATTTNSALYFRTGSISGGTITMGTETAYTGTPTYIFGIDTCPGASDGKVVLTYLDGIVDPGTTNAAWSCVTAYLTCSANTATVSYSTSFSSSAGGAYNQSPVWSVAQFTQGIAYGIGCISNGDNLKFIKVNYIDTIGGTTGAGIETLNLENETGAGVSATYAQYRPYVVGHNGNIYYGWAVYGGTDSVENVKTILCSSPAGSKIVYQSTTTRLAGDTTSSALPMFGNEMGIIATGFNTSNNGATFYGCIYIQRDKIFPFYTKSTLGIISLNTGNGAGAAWYSNAKDEIVLFDVTNYIKQWRLPTLFDGFASSTVSSGGSAQIIPFITTSGLTASARYYLKDTYTNAGELSTIGTLPLGNALSSTVLKSDKY